MKNKNAKLTLILSIVPGLSHLYLGKARKALVLLIIDAGLILTLIFAKSYLMRVIMVNIYVFTFFPAALETFSMAKGKKSRINTDSKWYTIVLLLTTGFNALPLLWQNQNFSKQFKLTWTIAVPLLALLFVFVLAAYWDRLEGALRTFLG